MKFFFNFHKKAKEIIEAAKVIQEQEKKDQVKKKTKPTSKDPEKIIIDIRSITVVRVTLMVLITLALAQFASRVANILLLVFIAIVFAAAISPLVDWLQRKKIPRALSIIVIYILFLGFVGVIASSVIPLVIKQSSELVIYLQNILQDVQREGIVEGIPFGERLEPYVQRFAENIDQIQLLDELRLQTQKLANNLGSIAGNAIATLFSLFGGILQAFVVLFITFFLVLDTSSFENFAISLIPQKNRYYIVTQANKIQRKLGAWLRGQIILSIVVGFFVWLGLTIIGVEYAFTFALIAAVTEFIPIIGPLISGIIAVPIIAIQSPVLAGVCIIFYLALNWIESNILVPLVMNKSIGLNPMIIVIAMLIGNKLLGPIGIVLAIPLAASLKVFVEDYVARSR